MRSFSSRRASEVNRSGGIHGMSRWQSAEILRYCMLFSPLRLTKGAVDDCTPSLRRFSSEGGLFCRRFCRHDMTIAQPALDVACNCSYFEIYTWLLTT